MNIEELLLVFLKGQGYIIYIDTNMHKMSLVSSTNYYNIIKLNNYIICFIIPKSIRIRKMNEFLFIIKKHNLEEELKTVMEKAILLN